MTSEYSSAEIVVLYVERFEILVGYAEMIVFINSQFHYPKVHVYDGPLRWHEVCHGLRWDMTTKLQTWKLLEIV